jgi:hypothetical protein
MAVRWVGERGTRDETRASARDEGRGQARGERTRTSRPVPSRAIAPAAIFVASGADSGDTIGAAHASASGGNSAA